MPRHVDLLLKPQELKAAATLLGRANEKLAQNNRQQALALMKETVPHLLSAAEGAEAAIIAVRATREPYTSKYQREFAFAAANLRRAAQQLQGLNLSDDLATICAERHKNASDGWDRSVYQIRQLVEARIIKMSWLQRRRYLRNP